MVSSYGLRPLQIEKALELYDLLDKYIPNYDKSQPILDFVSIIVKRIVDDHSPAFIKAITLMTDMNTEELSAFSPEHRLELFIAGLTVNNIVMLKRFCEDIGYGRK